MEINFEKDSWQPPTVVPEPIRANTRYTGPPRIPPGWKVVAFRPIMAGDYYLIGGDVAHTTYTLSPIEPRYIVERQQELHFRYKGHKVPKVGDWISHDTKPFGLTLVSREQNLTCKWHVWEPFGS